MAIEIVLDRQGIGRWTFPNASELQAQRISGGILLRLPALLTLRYSGQGLQPLASNLSMQVMAQERELGVATYDGFHSGGIPESELHIAMLWRVPSAVLEDFERMRDGGLVKLTFACRGEICGLVDSSQGPRLRTEPQLISGSVEVNYSRDAWTAMLNKVGFGLHVLVEVPLRPTPPPPWDGIWQALADARASFDQGGTTGWRNCVTSVRLALELWQKHEKEEHGPGWNPAKANDREARTAAQRVDNLRWHLLQCAHRAPHTHADDWSRDEAVLLLSTLTALLSVRDP